ncbi:MAG: hypothetical protein RIR43_1460 [Pseudomonadota bacterium]
MVADRAAVQATPSSSTAACRDHGPRGGGSAPSASAARSWRGELQLDYRLFQGRTVARDRHEGPLRVLKALYPDDGLTCEHVMVHPPGGLAGGDHLTVQAHLHAGSRVRVTTPGATRFYKSLGASAVQSVHLNLDEGARLEWLPMETIAYAGCRAVNECRISLAPGATMIGWDLCCLGLPASGDAFRSGSIQQHLEVQGVWLERGLIQAEDHLLRDSPLGLQGHPVVASLWCATGSGWSGAFREHVLQAGLQALTAAEADPARTARAQLAAGGITSPHDQVVVFRALADAVEPVFESFQRVRDAWHRAMWQYPAPTPRIWRL